MTTTIQVGDYVEIRDATGILPQFRGKRGRVIGFHGSVEFSKVVIDDMPNSSGNTWSVENTMLIKLPL